MYGTFYDLDYRMINEGNYYLFLYTIETFKVLADAVIPRTPGFAEEYGKIQYFGALNLHTDEYMVMTLNHYYIPLAQPAAAM